MARPTTAIPFLQLKKTAAQIAFESVPNARTFLREGFTTVRDVGVYRALNDVAMRDAIARGFIEGPRMYVAGAYVTITGGAGRHDRTCAPDITLPWDLRYGRQTVPGKCGRESANWCTTAPTTSRSSPAAPC